MKQYSRFFCLMLGIFFSNPIFAKDNLYWALDILNKSEILDPGQELQSCSGLASLTHADENISSTCARASGKYMSTYKGRKYCENVATNCFNLSFPKLGFYKGRDKCLNVSNICYNHKRSEGQSIKSSMNSCRD